MKKIILPFLGVILLSSSLFSCKGNDNKEKEENSTILNKDKQLNITFLLDLSDRIEPSKYPTTPSHSERDIAIINNFVEIFKDDMKKKGAFKMKGKMRVIFNPIPQDPEINTIAANLNVDVSSKQPNQKKEVYDNLKEKFTKNLEKIYNLTLKNKKYIGSDIWGFFKNDVQDLTIEKDPTYRNILVLITDGYIYHANAKMKEGNRHSYLLPQITKSFANSDYKEKLKEKDFGLINPRPDKDLNNLEVIVLEVNPSKQSPYEQDVMKTVLSNWLDEMGVAKYKIYQTDIPENTKKRIKDFVEEN